MNILGISALYHDAAAALVCDGEIVAAAQEERFTRKKHDERLPVHAIRYCLHEGGVGPEQLDAVAFYEKPITKFVRILESSFAVAPRGLRPFLQAMPSWLQEKLWIPPALEAAVEQCGITRPPALYFPEHHESHAASAFYPSPFPSAAILTIDGVGEWATTTMGRGDGNRIELTHELRFPHSLGLLYSAFTYFCGFRVNSGEYKLMGLAPFGEPRFKQVIYDRLIQVVDDGSFRLNLDYFAYHHGLTMTNERFAGLFNGPPRAPEAEITRREMDLARSVQEVTEEVVLRMARHLHALTGERALCLAGGVALNCVANGRLLREGPFERIWIQPAAGDAGGALGAALAVWHQGLGNERRADGRRDAMKGARLGPSFDSEVEAFLAARGYPHRRLAAGAWADEIAGLIADEQVVGVCEGRMEYGPRALGGRSILGDPRSPRMQSVMNLKIKFRESFRPFAPAVRREDVADWFELEADSPYMLLVAPVAAARRQGGVADDPAAPLRERIHAVRSEIPAVTHIDGSARVQTVDAESAPRFHALLTAFKERTGCPVLINTSFNVRGEPIVCTPEDAYRCFMRTEMDALVLGDFLLRKADQPTWTEQVDWRREHVLD